MFTKNMRIKRLFAYILDFMLITLVVGMISQLSYLNWDYDKYQENAMEYTELVENNEDLIALQKTTEFKNVTFNLSKYGVVYNIIEIVVCIAYFVFFQLYTGGQTLGKKIMKIKIVSDNKLSLLKLTFRSLLIYSLFTYVMLIGLVYILDVNLYLSSISIISSVIYLLNFVMIATIMFRKDNKGLHDIICNTEVVEVK